MGLAVKRRLLLELYASIRCSRAACGCHRQCVLELARSGADVKAVVSYHGILTTAMPAKAGAVKAHVAVYTGAKDPYAPREHVDALQDEMIAAGARWQITVFGAAYHAFTDPDAAVKSVSGLAYDPLADRLSWAGTEALLDALLQAKYPERDAAHRQR
jgi:dienelactone hydrolase